eukprot:Amastigsp_a184272_6.p2 type:complete len:195 gc:universal Amastigsp_a184272_6:933-1517(+)
MVPPYSHLYRCDVCGATGHVTSKPFHCVVGCAFDICRNCVRREQLYVFTEYTGKEQLRVYSEHTDLLVLEQATVMDAHTDVVHSMLASLSLPAAIQAFRACALLFSRASAVRTEGGIDALTELLSTCGFRARTLRLWSRRRLWFSASWGSSRGWPRAPSRSLCAFTPDGRGSSSSTSRSARTRGGSRPQSSRGG